MRTRRFARRRTLRSGLRFTSDGLLIRSPRLARLEAVLLVAPGELSAKKLAQTAKLADAAEVAQLIQILNESYDREGSAFRIENTAEGYLLMTRAAMAPWLDRIHNRQARLKLSAAAMETLTIIAYQQPVTRVEVEAVRGVQSTDLIRQLMDRGLIKIGGEDDSLGRPFLYITTKQFLSHFGLSRLSDLPNYESLRKQPKTNEEPKEALDEDPEDKSAAEIDPDSADQAA